MISVPQFRTKSEVSAKSCRIWDSTKSYKALCTTRYELVWVCICKTPHERIGLWSRKIPLDQFGVGWTIIKNWPGELMSRRDCLVAERYFLDSYGRVLIIYGQVLFKLDEFIQNQDDNRWTWKLNRELVGNTFSCLQLSTCEGKENCLAVESDEAAHHMSLSALPCVKRKPWPEATYYHLSSWTSC